MTIYTIIIIIENNRNYDYLEAFNRDSGNEVLVKITRYIQINLDNES